MDRKILWKNFRTLRRNMKNATPEEWKVMRSIQRNGFFGHPILSLMSVYSGEKKLYEHS